MNHYQFRAAFILESVKKHFDNLTNTDENRARNVQSLIDVLTSFEVRTNSNILENEMIGDGVLYVLHNLIIRGMPTFASYQLEKEFEERTGILQSSEKYGAIGFRIPEIKGLGDNLYKALHIIDPRVNETNARLAYKSSWEKLGSKYEEDFLYKIIPQQLKEINGVFFIQLMDFQRDLNTMVSKADIPEFLRSNFVEQKADFILEFPYLMGNSNRKGLCIEIDGKQHEGDSQKNLDKQRDTASESSGWKETIRIKTSDFENSAKMKKHFEIFHQLFKSFKYFKTIGENYKIENLQSQEWLLALEMVLSPIAVARAQLLLLKSIIHGALSLKDKKWDLIFIERDVPYAHLAVRDFKRMVEKLFKLEGKGRELPDIRITVLVTGAFKPCKLNAGEEIMLIDDFVENEKKFDVCFDISVLDKTGTFQSSKGINAKFYFSAKSSFYKKVEPVFFTEERISWKQLIDFDDAGNGVENKDNISYLRFFLQNIFRKKDFRTGQIPILNRALQNQTVIGLLPTGGGKSLTYQLAGLLQPGHTLVIDPIKSLMKDQVDGLKRIGITGAVFINSSLKTFEERAKAMAKIQNGNAIFCFVSPERLQMLNFREILKNMFQEKRYFAYGVIDEVHCVSEWGHDFRTSYLSLGTNLLMFCKSKIGDISLFGLTATASFDVLADVQRELSGNQTGSMISDEAIIRHENTNRFEVQYKVHRVELSDGILDDLRNAAHPGKFAKNVTEKIGQEMQSELKKQFEQIPETIQHFNSNQSEVISEKFIEIILSNGFDYQPETIFNDVQIENYRKDLFFRNYFENAGVVFTPHKSFYFGVTGRYKDGGALVGIADVLKNHFAVTKGLENLKIGTYLGSGSEDKNKTITIENDNEKNQDDFISNKLGLMVSTKAFGMGIDKPNIRYTFHISYPGSVESFVQEAGRAGRDGKMAVSTILLLDQKIEDKDKKGTIIEKGYDIQNYFYQISFKGVHKEKSVLLELLREIENPKKKRTFGIARQLEKSLFGKSADLSFILSPPTKKGHFRLYLNDTDGNNYGYIDLKKNTMITKDVTVSSEICKKYLDRLLSIIADDTDNLTLMDKVAWLNQEWDVSPTPGIESELKKMSFGETRPIVIPFTNDFDKVYHALTGRLLSFDATGVKPEHCKAAFNEDADTFIQGLFKIPGIPKVKINDAQIEEIKYIIDSIRDKSDTEKAIYRLTTIGVIDDYTVDFNSQTFTVTIKKKSESEYQQFLWNYLSKYYSNRRIEKIVEDLKTRKGDSEIQRILNFLIEFVYQEIAKKRAEAIKAMRSCCQVGHKDGNLEMKTWIHLYFNSKYARSPYEIEILKDDVGKFRHLPEMLYDSELNLYNASLQDWTDGSKNNEFDWVIDFMLITEYDRTNVQKDNLKHLKGACIRLLVNNPDNFTLRLLRAYTVLVLEDKVLTERQYAEVFEDIEIGIEKLQEYYGNNQEMVFNALKDFQHQTVRHITNPKVIRQFQEQFEEIMFLVHVNWAKGFTQEFTEKIKI